MSVSTVAGRQRRSPGVCPRRQVGAGGDSVLHERQRSREQSRGLHPGVGVRRLDQGHDPKQLNSQRA